MVLMMQFRNIQGPFCKDCGTAAVRTMTAQTMWQGWWGLASFFITPFTLLANVFLRSRLSRLGPAVRPAGTTPLDAGRPLIQRPALLGLLVPALVVGVVVIAVLSPDTNGGTYVPTTPTTPASYVGQCVRITTKDGQESARRVPCNVDHQGIITAEEQKEEDCPNDTVWVFDRDETSTILCVARA